jgi:putative PEP-CTERM system TPR-repeat lipoprotein
MTPYPHRAVSALLGCLLLVACVSDSGADLIASARKYLAEGNAKSATIQLKSALQKLPNSGEARFLLAQTLLDSGDAVGAETEVRKALALQWSEDQAYPLLARALLAQGEYRRVSAELDGRELHTPEARADLAVSLGLARLVVDDVPGAQQFIARAVRESPNNVRVLLAQSDLARRQGDAAAEIGFLDHVLKQQPANPDATVRRAEILGAQNQLEAALKLLEDAAATRPNDVALRFALVNALVRAGRADAAEVQVAKLREIAPRDIRTLYADALSAFSKGDTGRARDVLQRLLGAVPDHLPAQMLNGLVQFQLGSYALAEDSFRKVLARMPAQPNAVRMLAATFVKTGRSPQALEVLAPMLKAGSTDPFVWRTAGEAALAVGDARAAAAHYERAAGLDTGSVATQVRLAQVRMATGESERALRDLETISRADTAESQADLALVAAYLRKRQYDQALTFAQNVVKKFPDKAASYMVVGTVQMAKRDLAGARASFNDALGRDPAFVQAARNLALIDLQEGKAADARGRYEAMLVKYPEDEDLLLAAANLTLIAGEDVRGARKLIDRAIVAHPASSAPRLASISLAMRERDTKAALAAAQAAATAIPGDPQLQEALAEVQLASGAPIQAIEILRRLVNEHPDNASALLRLAQVQAGSNDLPGAIVSVRKALALKPDSTPARRLLTSLQVANHQNEQAITEARALQKSRPGEGIGFALEGDVRSAEGRWPDAAMAYRAALARQAQSVFAGRLYASLVRAGKAGEAATFATQWNRQHPDDITLHLLVAQQAQERKDLPTAVAEYRAGLAIQPENWLMLNNIAWVLSGLGDPTARDFAERAYLLAPFNPGVMDTLGSVLVASGQTDRGIYLLRMAANLAPQSLEIRLHLGKALAKAGDKSAARRELELVAKGDPKSRFRADAEKTLTEL